ncbi:quinone oxidoreductase family protein [Phenylobacterium immobile]|uniref:quinone oxidoreductase family protein n=1 Tax=Phenylobacterium immobile TaxID=21 RepID=UPI000AEA4B96|nr:zinc-binding dehydrogenase [Phenylobacterium immobile]
MRVARYHKKGPPEVLQVEDIATPEPAEGEALVRVEATGVTYADVLRRGEGYYPVQPKLPHIPGNLAVAMVEAVGPGGDAGLVGQRVLANVFTGAYAEQGLAKIATFRKIPDGVDPIDALAIFSEAETAGLAVRAAGKLQPGETVFVPAATGGVGFLVVQFARLWGAKRVFGAASTPEKRAVVESLGAIPIDYTIDGWSKEVIEKNEGRGVDLAFEVTGGPVFYETFNAVRPGGRVVNYGNVTDTDSPINPRQLLRKNQALIGFYRGAGAADNLFVEERAQLYKDLDVMLAKGELKAAIGKTFTLDQAADAHRALEGRASPGKVILLPNG